MSCDKIILKGMCFYGYHGAFTAEREMGQRFIVDLEMSLDVTQSAKADDIELTVNYAEAFEIVREIVETREYELLETLAVVIAETILNEYPSIMEVCVKTKKPNAPVEGILDYVAIEVTRGR